jgi:hypothetical protein
LAFANHPVGKLDTRLVVPGADIAALTHDLSSCADNDRRIIPATKRLSPGSLSGKMLWAIRSNLSDVGVQPAGLIPELKNTPIALAYVGGSL